MTSARPRSPSSSDELRAAKRVRTDGPARDVVADFHTGLLDPKNAAQLHTEYATSGPYLHAVIDKLFNDSLLRKASEEIIRELHFTEKETDIYKVHQTGDLASLSYLTQDQIQLLPSLLALRNALYSPEFRSFVRSVTGCGPLSGKMQDMSVNSYRAGCHLLNHDDVIGSRRVSYILYMPLPYGKPWKAEYGGALELYPMLDSPEAAKAKGRLPEPDVLPSKIIPPSWNQFVFFEIQPGKSFHSVEEVVVDVSDDGKQRLSISGWFHKPQSGEEGYADADDAVDRLKSSLEQLADAPAIPMRRYAADEMLPTLSEADRTFLARFLNDAYLSPANLPSIAESFADNSEIQLHEFLRAPLAKRVQAALSARDVKDKLNIAQRPGSAIPAHDVGKNEHWEIRGPPHKARFCVLQTATESAKPSTAPELPNDDDELETLDEDTLLQILQETLLASDAFRSWLAVVSSFVPLGFQLAARRFRPGLDYTLATTNEEDVRLDVLLDLTPGPASPTKKNSKGKTKTKAVAEEPVGWQTGEWGGWVCYMAPHEGEEDPAVYRSGSSKKRENGEDGAGKDKKDGDPMDEDADAEGSDEEKDEDEDEDGTLLTVQPAFNRLLLTLRDARVLHFVKYVSAAAHGSRWDIAGEWEIGQVADSDEEEHDHDHGDHEE